MAPGLNGCCMVTAERRDVPELLRQADLSWLRRRRFGRAARARAEEFASAPMAATMQNPYRRIAQERTRMSELPLVSVVIPMRNESTHIGACIDAVLAQDYPTDRIEIVVIDGDSDDDSARVLRGYGGRIRVLHNPSRIVPTAMNIGITAACGEIIARVDAHTVVAPEYIWVGVETLQRTGADNVGGPMNAVGGGRWGTAIALAMGSRFGIGAYFHFAAADREVDTVYMGMYPRRVFERIGLFDEELVRNQDDELNYRLRKSGGRIFLTTRMQSRYQNRQSVTALVRQFFEYGWWKIRVLQKHPAQMSVRHFVPPSLVLSLVVSAVLTPWSAAAGWLFCAIAGAYVVAVTACAASVAPRHGCNLVAPVAAAFAAIHLSWGTGFVLGALRFAPRWLANEPQPPRLRAQQVAGTPSIEWKHDSPPATTP
ncbi:MAG: glycosyltransferase family 2 protein [Candidatus Binatia bacterium]